MDSKSFMDVEINHAENQGRWACHSVMFVLTMAKLELNFSIIQGKN